jgi:hypothetical protein
MSAFHTSEIKTILKQRQSVQHATAKQQHIYDLFSWQYIIVLQVLLTE